jgi:hypothetical protein
MEAERNADRLSEGNSDDQAIPGDGEAENENLRAAIHNNSLTQSLERALAQALEDETLREASMAQ